MSKEAKIIDLDVDARVDDAINNAMDIYMNKLASGFIDVGLENTFQMHLATIIGKELDQYTFYDDERFIVEFEKNIPINGNKDYIDIVIEYKRSDYPIKLFLIELKFKKVSDGAHDLGNIESYKDMYNLDCHKSNTQDVCGCYFIFLTNDGKYLNKSKKSVSRNELPMFDGCVIQANNNYNVSQPTALKATSKYPNGFVFSSDYLIEYQHINIPNVNTKEKDYWFYVVKI